jgi:hypothetical protein
MRVAETAEDVARETVSDARWFPLRFNVQSRELQFALIPAQIHREVVFLKDLRPAPGDMRILPRSAIAGASVDAPGLHLILHSGLGGSTLLARVLGQQEVATPLQEPPILTDVVSYGLSNPQSDTKALLDDVTRLLSRPLSPGERIVCKMNSVGNGLGAAMAALNPGSQILCIQTRLDEMLTSFASRGIEGRIAGRKLLIGLRNSRMLPIELSEKELGEHTDLQLVALSWLSMRTAMLDAAARLGPSRVRSIKSEQLFQEPRDALTAISKHFRIDLNVDDRLKSGLFDRHAKSGEPFDSKRRSERIAETLRIHGREIEPVVSWTKKVAEAVGIPLELPYPLLD